MEEQEKKQKSEYKKINITLKKEILKKLEDGNFNKSKLVEKLISEYFSSQEKNKKNLQD